MPGRLHEAGDIFGIAVTLALTFVLGLEREEAAAREHGVVVAGVRTIPIIGLLGHGLMLLSTASPLPVVIGIAVVGGFLLVSYWQKIQRERVGVTSESTALIGYVVGALVASQHLSEAAGLTVATVLLLTGKQPLRHFATGLPPQEITRFVTFLLLAGVILPVLPNQEFTRFRFNPFQIWLVVVAVSGISYASYVLQRMTRSDQSLLLTALLGGLYSSTATTVALARRSVGDSAPRAYAGGVILAGGTMYVRILILVWTFSNALGRRLAPAMVGLAVLSSAAGVAMILLRPQRHTQTHAGGDESHPLAIGAAVVFAALFIGLTVATQLTAQYLGSAGLMLLAVLVGFTDIVPFILGLADSTRAGVTLEVAIAAIMVAIASNQIVKGVYAIVLGDRRAGVLALGGLTVVAALTVLAGTVL